MHHDGRDIGLKAAKERALLGILLLEHGQVVGVDRVVDELWPDAPPQQPVSSVRVLASRVRRSLATAGYEDRLRTVPPGYVLAIEPVELDAARFEIAAREGARLLDAGDAARAADALREALELWRGDVLADVELGDASIPAVRRLTEARLGALEQRIEADLQCGRDAVVVGELGALVQAHPLRGGLWLMLVVALARSGRQPEALRRCAEWRSVLADIGLEPSPQFVALESAVALHDPGLGGISAPRARTGGPAAASRPPLPQVLAQGLTPLMGRRPDLARILTIFDSVACGDSVTALVSGEPGAGKTSLVREAAAILHDRGSTVLYGWCDEDLQIAYQPFREALQSYLATLSPTAVQEVLARWPRLGRLAGPFGDRFDPSRAQGGDAEGERILLFESVEGWLHDLAAHGPVVLVIDDLHWGSAPTVQLVRHLSHPRGWPLLCLLTFRDTDAEEPAGLREMLASVHRQANIHRVAVQGLDRDAIADLVSSRTGHALEGPDLVLADRIHEETGGNPFFATQLVRHLIESGSDLSAVTEQFQLPDGVRDVIRHRLERLSPAANQVLRVAATIGPVAPFALVAAVTASEDTGGLLDALDEATAARLLVETADAEFVFVHALVRKTIYAGLSAARRRELHRKVSAAALLMPTPLPNQTVLLAYHSCLGAAPGDGSRAAYYALLAGREALEQVAHETALEQFGRGLEVLERYGPPDPVIEADLYLGIAESCSRTNDRHGMSRAAWRAAAAAQAAGSAERVAEAAFWAAQFGVVGSLDERVLGLCESALEQLGEEPSPIKARVTAVLAGLRALAGEGVDADPIAVRALEIARATGDPVALVEALDARITTLGGDPDVGRRLVLAEEMMAIAIRASDLGSLGHGHRFRATARLMSGDRSGFDEDHAAVQELGERMRDGFLRAVAAQWRATVALLDGRFGDVESHAGEAVELSSHDTNFVNAWVAQVLWLHHEQGRLAELLPLIEATVDDNPGIVGFRAALAMTYATLGRPDDARFHLSEILAGRPQPIPPDWIQTTTLTLCAEAAALIGDSDAAAQLEPRLQPFSGQLVLAATGTHCPGAVDRFLGMLAAQQGRFADARSLLSSALVLEERIRATPNTARTRLWYARALIGDGADPETARQLAKEAAATAERLGLAGVGAEAAALAGKVTIDAH
ncbi:MAG: hypothetical protein NVS1B12_03000 [Acidimicrobiales bacterium]